MTDRARDRSHAAIGRRARLIRVKMLGSLKSEIDAGVPWRQIAVTNVARDAGRSPGAFYWHWPDVETAVLELARNLVASGEPPSEHLRLIILLLGMEGYDVPALPEGEQ